MSGMLPKIVLLALFHSKVLNLHDSEPLTRLWIPFTVLHVSGQAGIFIILLTIFLSSQVHFHPTIVNFWIAWFIYSVSYSLK